MLGPALSVWLLPPVNLVLFGLLGMLTWGRWRRTGRSLTALCLVLLLVLALPIVGEALLATLERNLPLSPPAGDPPGAIVLLGGDVARGLEPPADVGALSLERVRAAAELQRRTHLPILVTGGQLGYHEPSIAELMAQVLTQEFGAEVRWTETDSIDTWENAEDSAPILKAAGVRSVYVVTHAGHMRRAILSFRRQGIAVTAAPVRLDRYPTVVFRDFIPNISAWGASYFALHEWIGYVGYALFL